MLIQRLTCTMKTLCLWLMVLCKLDEALDVNPKIDLYNEDTMFVVDGAM